MTYEVPNEASVIQAETPVKRGRGRPKGSRNKQPRQARELPSHELSPEEREALKCALVAEYRSAVADNAVTSVRLRGVKAIIRSKLGRAGLAEVEADFIRSTIASENEREHDVAPASAING